MTDYGQLRGHPIYWGGDSWRYCDTGEPTAETWLGRNCGHCGLYAPPGEPDPCLGYLPGVSNACCGHGNADTAYIQFENGFTVRGIQRFEYPECGD